MTETKTSWMLSEQADTAYSTAAIITACNVVLQLILLFTLEPGNYEVSHTYAGFVLFGILLVFAAFMLFAQLFLWLSMLWFLFKYDSFSMVWLLLMLFTLSVGAAAYYFSRYRKMLPRFVSIP